MWLVAWWLAPMSAVARGERVGRQAVHPNLHSSLIDPCRTQARGRHTKSFLGGASTILSRQKKVMAVPGFEPGSSGSQPLMLTTTLYHHGWNTGVRVDIKMMVY